MNHELVFIGRITPEEFEKQKGDFTKEQVEKLQNSKEYKAQRRLKGKEIENWNWQTNETINGAPSDISSEYDIISNYNKKNSLSELSSYESDHSEQLRGSINGDATENKVTPGLKMFKKRFAKGLKNEYPTTNGAY